MKMLRRVLSEAMTSVLVIFLLLSLGNAWIISHPSRTCSHPAPSLPPPLRLRLQATRYFPIDREDAYDARSPHSARRRLSGTRQVLAPSFDNELQFVDDKLRRRPPLAATLEPDSFHFSGVNHPRKTVAGSGSHGYRTERREDDEADDSRWVTRDWRYDAASTPPSNAWFDHPRRSSFVYDSRSSRHAPVSRDSSAQSSLGQSSPWYDRSGSNGSASPTASRSSTSSASARGAWSSSSSLSSSFSKPRCSVSRDEENNYWFVNYERLSRGLPEVLWSNDLIREAQRWARCMASTSVLRHRDNLSENVDVGWKCVTENVAYNMSPSYDGAHTSLMKSPGHRRNILDPLVNRIGVGISKVYYPGSDVYQAGDLYYVVHIFKQM